MGAEYGAWTVTVGDIKHVIVAKAFCRAQSIARQRFGPGHKIELACSRTNKGGVVIIDSQEGDE